MEDALNQAHELATHLGFKLIEGHDARGGRYRVLRGRDIVHHADDIRDVAGFLNSWAAYVH